MTAFRLYNDAVKGIHIKIIRKNPIFLDSKVRYMIIY